MGVIRFTAGYYVRSVHFVGHYERGIKASY